MSPWKKTDTEVLAETSIFTLKKSRVENPRTGAGFLAYTLDCPDWVNVIAFDKAGGVILVKQYRLGVERPTLEIPGGMVDPGETHTQAGVRELLEETGYAPGRVVELGFVAAQPAFQNNRCHTILALNCERTAELNPDQGEDLTVEVHPLAEIERMMREHEIDHGLVLAAFMRYRLWKEAAGR